MYDYYNTGASTSTSRGAGTYNDSQILRLDAGATTTAEITDYLNPDSDIGILKGASWNEDGIGSDSFNAYDGSYGVSLTATDTVAYIADLDGATTARYNPVFKIRGWTTTSTPNYVALNG